MQWLRRIKDYIAKSFQVDTDEFLLYLVLIASDASKCYQEGKNQNKLRIQEDIEPIVKTYQDFKAAKPLNYDEGVVIKDKYAYRATLKEIKENDYNLNIPRYVDTFEEEAPLILPIHGLN